MTTTSAVTGPLTSPARVGVTGRLVQQATDTRLLLAGLVDAEGKPTIARDLILKMGMGRFASIVACSRHVAEQHGAGAVRSRRSPPSSPIDGDAVRGQMAVDIATLRREMTHRGLD